MRKSTCFFFALLCFLPVFSQDVFKSLDNYHQQLQQLRTEFRAYPMPVVKFFLFGMGNRKKLIYQNGQLKEYHVASSTASVIKSWSVTKETIIPNEYMVVLETSDKKAVTIYENEKGVYVIENAVPQKIPGTETPVLLPSFSEYKYSQVLKVLHHEILINIVSGEPVPNFCVYKKAWRRDGAMMAMVLKKTGNLELIRNWAVGLTDPYDRNNNGETEADNLGETLYILSFFAENTHPLVNLIMNEVAKYEVTDSHGKYIKGRSDFHETPVYQTKWLKYGLKAFNMADPYSIPKIQDNYSALFWWDYKESYMPGTIDAYDQWKDDKYPYIGWAADHFHGLKRNPISDQDYPLSWEIEASQANYAAMSVIDAGLVGKKVSIPHTWHAAEMFLYFMELR